MEASYRHWSMLRELDLPAPGHKPEKATDLDNVTITHDKAMMNTDHSIAAPDLT